MSTALALVAIVVLARLPLRAGDQAGRFAPAYSPSTIVNAASQLPGALSPNSIATLYGSDLAYVTRGLLPGDLRDGVIPSLLTGSGVRVIISGNPAPIYYVSPRQVNFLVPANLRPGAANWKLQLVLEGRAGPEVPVEIATAAPALFLQQPGLAIATRADGSLVSPESPATAGEVIVLYATGLGEAATPVRTGELVAAAVPLKPGAGLEILADGNRIAAEHVLYAGLAPGFAGLYQINVRLPAGLGPDPEIRIGCYGVLSPGGVRISVR